MKLRRAVPFLLKRALILFGSVIPCLFVTISLLARTKLTPHHSWLLALFISGAVGGAVLGLAERFLRSPA
jgi:fucose permease